MEKEKILQYFYKEEAALFQEADQTRKMYCGDEVHLRGIIEFSNYCKRDCLYCGLRRSNNKLTRYRLSVNEIFEISLKASDLGYETIVLQSGEDEYYGIEDLCRLVSRIKKELKCAVTLCIGERTFEDYKSFKEAGADRYLLKFETSDKNLFCQLKPDSSYEKRLECIYFLKTLGYEIGSGNMVGLPGQSVETLAEDILFMYNLDLDMIGIGPFIPHPDTPLKDSQCGSLIDTLKTVAVTRIVTKNTHIPATTAVGSIEIEGRQKALQCGANVIMPNLTPVEYREYYQLYPNKICLTEKPSSCRACLEGIVRSLGRTIAQGCGPSLKKNESKKEVLG